MITVLLLVRLIGSIIGAILIYRIIHYTKWDGFKYFLLGEILDILSRIALLFGVFCISDPIFDIVLVLKVTLSTYGFFFILQEVKRVFKLKT